MVSTSPRCTGNDHPLGGTTALHGFFLAMGGFTLHDEQGAALRILEPMELESLSEAGKIEWPSITKEEIQDRSKGDYLSKGIVIVQTSWFIAQCIVRGVYKLEVTELEVATLAFAALNGVTYYLWWHKPLDVRCSIPVYLLKDDEKEKVDNQSITSVSLVVPISPPISCEPTENLKANNIDSQSPIVEESRVPQQPLVVIPDPEPTLQESSHHNANIMPPLPQNPNSLDSLLSFGENVKNMGPSWVLPTSSFSIHSLHSLAPSGIWSHPTLSVILYPSECPHFTLPGSLVIIIMVSSMAP